MSEPGWNEDFEDLVGALLDAGVRFLIVGAHALAVHGVPRATQDLDVWVEASADNARRVMAALEAFGAPLRAHGITGADFEVEGSVYQLGLPPSRIDLLTSLSGVDFEPAWGARVEARLGRFEVPFIGPESQLANKLASGRDKDLVDARLLRKILDGSDS